MRNRSRVALVFAGATSMSLGPALDQAGANPLRRVMPSGPALPLQEEPPPDEGVQTEDVEGDGFVLVSDAGLSTIDTVVAGVADDPGIAGEARTVIQGMVDAGTATAEQATEALRRIDLIVANGPGAIDGLAPIAQPVVPDDDPTPPPGVGDPPLDDGGEQAEASEGEVMAAASSVPALVGYAINNNRTWYIHRWLNGFYCNSHKQCEEVVRLDVKFWIDPGASSSKISWQKVAVRGNGWLNPRVGALANYDGRDYGADYRDIDDTTSGSFYVYNGSRQRGNDIRHYVTVQSTLTCAGIPNCSRSTWMEHRGRTGYAHCHSYDNVCPY